LLSAGEARAMSAASRENAEVIFPYLVGEELLTEPGGQPTRWVIDFHPRDLLDAQRHRKPFDRIKGLVLPDRERAAEEERARNAELEKRGNHHHENFLRRWWQLSYPRAGLVSRLATLKRYVACSRITKRPIFAFVSSAIRPGDALMVFPFEDDYAFGILQSGVHWAWFKARCSTLTARFRYTSDTVFDSFPWPQAAGAKQVAAVARASVEVRMLRRDLARRHAQNLRALYASMEEPGQHPLKDAHAALDAAVRAAYGMGPRKDPLAFLLELNEACAEREAEGKAIVGPGLPPGISTKGLVTKDAVEPPDL
jgi:hypothetical protein